MQHATIIASLIDNPFLGLPLSFFIDKHWQTQSCFHQMTIHSIQLHSKCSWSYYYQIQHWWKDLVSTISSILEISAKWPIAPLWINIKHLFWFFESETLIWKLISQDQMHSDGLDWNFDIHRNISVIKIDRAVDITEMEEIIRQIL